MKRFITFLCVLGILLSMTVTASAAGTVTYNGTAQKFIFEPGSNQSPTDLFSDFKNVMPGDSLTQKISGRSARHRRLPLPDESDCKARRRFRYVCRAGK